MVHHTSSVGKSYVQPNIAELLVKEQIRVLHVAICVIPVTTLVLLSWLLLRQLEEEKKKYGRVELETPAKPKKHPISCILPLWKACRVSEDDTICFRKWQRCPPI